MKWRPKRAKDHIKMIKGRPEKPKLSTPGGRVGKRAPRWPQADAKTAPRWPKMAPRRPPFPANPPGVLSFGLRLSNGGRRG